MAHYRVEMTGHVGSRFTDAFDVLLLEVRRGRTILTLDLPDQAALHGFLEMVEASGIELVAVNRMEPAEGDALPSPG